MSTFVQKFTQNLIENTRYMYLLKGLGNTIIITVFALMIGIVLGFLVAVVRSTHEKHGGLNVLNFICKVYLTVWRGTPTVVQVMIMYYVILVAVNNKILVAVIAFGLNSAAYVAEIVRSGIMSIDEGQMEAGRSHADDHSAAGIQKRASGTGKRADHAVKGNFRQRLYRHDGSDKGCGYHQKPDL